MATERYFYCPTCQKKDKGSANLFTLLQNLHQLRLCSCGNIRDLRLIPPFALGAGGKSFKVLDAFHEKIAWKNQGTKVTFYPFLVVIEDIKTRHEMVWLPYWHLDGAKLKYGERAPWMAATLFRGLLAKAREKGYFENGTK